MRTISLFALFLFAQAAPRPDNPVTLTSPPPIAGELDAMPRLVAKSDDAAAARINRALARTDDDAKSEMHDCLDSGGKYAEFSRSVSVTMRGPRYLSFVVTENWYCGGPYPAVGRTAFVYDLAAGALVNWLTLLPASLHAQARPDGAADGKTPDVVTSPALTSLYVARSESGRDPECADAFTTWPLTFMFWPDAETGGIAFEPTNIPHVEQACADTVTISEADARTLGFSGGLLDALHAAHTALRGGAGSGPSGPVRGVPSVGSGPWGPVRLVRKASGMN